MTEEVQGLMWVENGTKNAVEKMAKHLEGLTGMELDVGVGPEKNTEVRETEGERNMGVEGKDKEVEKPESPVGSEQEVVMMEEENLDVEQEK